MKFNDDFLEALGGWQRGWREKQNEKAIRTAALVRTLRNVPEHLRSVAVPCYRKRFLLNSELQPLFLGGEIDEGISSWTADIAFARNFHGFWREGTFASIFCRKPLPEEVLLNVEALWTDDTFVAAAEAFRGRGGTNNEALFNFRDSQREVILDAKLWPHEVVGFTGKSSSFEELCQMAGVTTPEGMDKAFQALAKAGEYPEEPAWINPEAAQRVIRNTRQGFQDKLAELQCAQKRDGV
jgi:hypothetical protein